MRDYFYGIHGDLNPHSQSLGFNEIHIYRVGGGPRAPSSALPIGATSAQDPLRLNKVREIYYLFVVTIFLFSFPYPNSLMDVCDV